MKVLVTGHHGYIGSVVVPVLADAGHTVVGLDTLFYEGCDLVPDALDVPALTLDVRDVTPETLAGYDAVVHLAALSNDPLGDLSARWTYEINLEGTLALARAAKAAGVRRFVFSSSCSMYGASERDQLVGEEAPLMPLTAYAESKVRSEQGLAALADETFSPVFMRNATAYGVSPRMRLDLVLNNLVAWAVTTGKVRIMSDGTPWRPLVHVDDIARAVLHALEAPIEAVHNQALNVGAPSENYQVRELADVVRETVPGCTIEYAGAGDPDPRSYRVDFTKVSQVLPDFRVRWTVRAGAAELYEAYTEAGLTLAKFEGDTYVRLRRLQRLLANGALDDDLRWRDRARRLAPAASVS
jgi:nucleoside-diphosphate-sugar epimerase